MNLDKFKINSDKEFKNKSSEELNEHDIKSLKNYNISFNLRVNVTTGIFHYCIRNINSDNLFLYKLDDYYYLYTFKNGFKYYKCDQLSEFKIFLNIFSQSKINESSNLDKYELSSSINMDSMFNNNKIELTKKEINLIEKYGFKPKKFNISDCFYYNLIFNNSLCINLVKEDDYYYIEISTNKGKLNFYKCDQISELKNFLSKINLNESNRTNEVDKLDNYKVILNTDEINDLFGINKLEFNEKEINLINKLGFSIEKIFYSDKSTFYYRSYITDADSTKTSFNIAKGTDDYYYIELYYNLPINVYYKCDQLSELKKVLLLLKSKLISNIINEKLKYIKKYE